MRASELGKLLAGSSFIYAVVAACGSSADGTPPAGLHASDAAPNMAASRGGAGGSPGNGGNGGTASGQLDGNGYRDAKNGRPQDASIQNDSALVDAFLKPVRDARADVATSGTRLKARYLVGDDGSRQFAGWFDSQRGENCSFTMALGGMTRCVPTISAYATGTSFADSSCAQEVVSASTASTTCGDASSGSAGGTPPKYVAHLATGCGTTPTLHQIGTPLSGTTYYVKAGASCISVPVPTGVALYYIGSEIPSSSFVAATEQTGP